MAINTKQYIYDGMDIHTSSFTDGKVHEYSVMLYGDCFECNFSRQAGRLVAAFKAVTARLCPDAGCVFKRYFVSDAANFAQTVREIDGCGDCAVSIIEQPPLTGAKIALWAHLQTNIRQHKTPGGLFAADSGNHVHLWTASNINGAKDSYGQTRDILGRYASSLEQENCNMELNCIRTWFFIHNIDEYYAGMVKGRNDEFDKHGLVPGNHFIASTGICGRTDFASRHVMMDAYAVKGISREQVKFLYASDHLNNTSEYGVRFERGTAVDYGDRRQVFISGTASIDNKGEVMYEGDIEKQTLRMIDNVNALLEEAGCTAGDICSIIVYLRDLADYKTADAIMEAEFGPCPRIMVLAPVCRPKWLIEMECIAIKAQKDDRFADY